MPRTSPSQAVIIASCCGTHGKRVVFSVSTTILGAWCKMYIKGGQDQREATAMGFTVVLLCFGDKPSVRWKLALLCKAKVF